MVEQNTTAVLPAAEWRIPKKRQKMMPFDVDLMPANVATSFHVASHRSVSWRGRFLCMNTENPGSLYDKLPGPPCVVGTLVVKEKQIMENSPADTGIIPYQLAAD